jgi:uncharacterized membrane protein YkvA (DUF1232 family)
LSKDATKADRPPGLDDATATAETFAQDKTTAKYLLDAARRKAQENRATLKKSWEDLSTLLRLVNAWVDGAYSQVPWKTVVSAIAALIYFVNPFDVVPDFIPFSGFVDDATVIGFVLTTIQSEIDKFRQWERLH